MCKQKSKGGLGFWDIEAFHEALLIEQLWWVLKNEASLVPRALKARYYPHCNILEASLSTNPTFAWLSIVDAKNLVISGSRWIIGNNFSVDV